MSRKKLTQSIYKMVRLVRFISNKQTLNMGKGVHMSVNVTLSELNKFDTETLIRFSDLLKIGLTVQDSCRTITHAPRFRPRQNAQSSS